jgi:hypothetical protein
MEGSEEQGVEQQGSEQQGAEQMGIEGNQQMDMDNNDNDGEHETETDGAEMADGHETSDSTTSDSGHMSRRKSHTVMPPLVLDSEDEKIVIKPTSDG